MITRRSSLAAAAGVAILLTLGGCLAPAPGGGVVVGPPNRPVAFNPDGRWCWQDNRGRRHVHFINGYRGGMVIDGRGRERRREFRRIRQNAYAEIDGPGIYEFHGNGRATWTRNPRRGAEFAVWRCDR